MAAGNRWRVSKAAGVRPVPSTACSDPWKEHIEKGCGQQTSMHTWTCLPKHAQLQRRHIWNRKGKELAEYKSSLCQETQAEAASTWRAEARPPETMILVLGWWLATMQGLQCGWVNKGETHTQEQDRNPIPKRIGEAGEAYLFTWSQPIPQNLLDNKCWDSGSL